MAEAIAWHISQLKSFTLGLSSHPSRQGSPRRFSCALETHLLALPGRSSGQAEVECSKQLAMSRTWLRGSFYLLTAACDFPLPVVSQMLTVPTIVIISLQQVSEGLVGRG